MEGFDRELFDVFINHVLFSLFANSKKELLTSVLKIDVESLGVEPIRKIPLFLEKTSWEGAWRVVIVYNADTMTPQAQNSLLKSLEEPPYHSLIILHSSKQKSLLQTLYSRGLVLNNAQLETENEHITSFLEQWSQAFFLLVNHQNANPLMELQAWCDTLSIDPETQGKWVLIALKKEIDKDISNEFLLESWRKGIQTFLDIITLKLDTKYMCAKLTAALL